MAARAAMTPSYDSYDPSIRIQSSASVKRQRNLSLHETQGADLASLPSNPVATSPLAQSFEMARRSSRGTMQDEVALHLADLSSRTRLEESTSMQRSASVASRASVGSGISRSNTLKKQKSLSRRNSLKRSGSKRSVRPASIGGITYGDTSGVEDRSVFYTPVPTTGSPTDILANRFQGWRKVLKDLMGYFREVQNSYETRAKAASKLSNTINNLGMSPGLLQDGGLGDATVILQQYHKQALAEISKAKDIEQDVIAQLSGLRNDLSQKIKEIKSLSGDFRNTIDKEKAITRKVVSSLQDAVAAVDSDAKTLVGKDDPYIVRLQVDRQVERQVDEENYLHRAYLNLEGSGRELEAIVVGEIQKAYNAFAAILKKEADEAYDTVEKLRSGPIALPRDLEWSSFVERDPHFVNPHVPLRRAQDLEYPGRHHPASAEVRAGMLERKSKYLKSYTPGWLVLSPTHLHEFKSADSVYTQAPVMSLYLPDQRLGSHSQPGANSHKFILKGRQTGTMHRGHSWVFRAESYDTMLAWYDDIKSLTEKSGEERNAFVRRHTRTRSNQSNKSVSSLEEDEADRIPYQASNLGTGGSSNAVQDQRPQPGGRFPSDVQIRSDLPPRLSPSDGSEVENDITSAAGEIQGGSQGSVQRDEYFSGVGGVKKIGLGTDAPSSPNGVDHTTEPTELESITSGSDALNREHDINYAFSPGRVTSYETPKPVERFVPQPQKAEFLRYSSSTTQIVPSGESHSTIQLASTKDETIISTASEKTGAPALERKCTSHSVGNYHVPGEFPHGTVPT